MNNLLLCSGYFHQFRDLIEKSGGVTATFPKGIDLLPYLQKNNLSVYIDDGWLDLRIITTGLSIYEAITFGAGCLVQPRFQIWGNENQRWEIIPYFSSLQCILLPQKKVEELMRGCAAFWESCRKTHEEILHFSMLNTALFHAGSGVARVCNYLWHYDALRSSDKRLPPITQDKIMYKTLLSKSQLTRVLLQLRREGVVRTHYRSLEITDHSALQEHISRAMPDSSAPNNWREGALL